MIYNALNFCKPRTTVVIKDVSGQEFKTSHNIVVETVLKTVKEVLDAKIQEVEEQINFIV